jgi:hypothetical protein
LSPAAPFGAVFYVFGAQGFPYLPDDPQHKGVVIDDKEFDFFQVFGRHGPLNPHDKIAVAW